MTPASFTATTRSRTGPSARFIWSGVTTQTPRWEQAFSDDSGETWETNWVMDFTPNGRKDVSAILIANPSPVQFRTDYRHISKLVRPAPAITLDDAVLKWYDIAPADEPVPCEVQVLARGNLRAAAESGSLDLADELGFVILHRCGESFYFLIVATWRNDNEVWETVWAKNGESEFSFRPWTLEGTPRPTFCVWELGAAGRATGVEPLPRSPRGAAAREAYLRDTFEARSSPSNPASMEEPSTSTWHYRRRCPLVGRIQRRR